MPSRTFLWIYKRGKPTMYCFVILQKGLRSVFDESSQTAWFYLHHFQHLSLYSNQFTQNLNKLYTSIFRNNRSIYWWKPHENPFSSFRVFREQTERQTDRRGGGLCFIICIDIYFFKARTLIVGRDILCNMAVVHGAISFSLVWRCHQLLSVFLAKGHLPRVSVCHVGR